MVTLQLIMMHIDLLLIKSCVKLHVMRIAVIS